MRALLVPESALLPPRGVKAANVTRWRGGVPAGFGRALSQVDCGVEGGSWVRHEGVGRPSPVCIVGRQKVPYVKERRGSAVKKLLLVALAAIGGLLVYRQIQADRAEQDLWTEATDSVPTGS